MTKTTRKFYAWPLSEELYNVPVDDSGKIVGTYIVSFDYLWRACIIQTPLPVYIKTVGVTKEVFVSHLKQEGLYNKFSYLGQMSPLVIDSTSFMASKSKTLNTFLTMFFLSAAKYLYETNEPQESVHDKLQPFWSDSEQQPIGSFVPTHDTVVYLYQCPVDKVWSITTDLSALVDWATVRPSSVVIAVEYNNEEGMELLLAVEYLNNLNSMVSFKVTNLG